MNKVKHKIFISLFFINVIMNVVYSQEEATQRDVIVRKGIVFYEGQPFSGWLLSDETISGNSCECTLKARYKRGKLNGLKQEWYNNGRLKYSGKYKDNIKIGTHKYFYSNGKLKEIVKYSSGQIVEKTYYQKNGKKQKIEEYHNGKLIRTIDLNKKNRDYESADYYSDVKNDEKEEITSLQQNKIIQLTDDNEDLIPPRLLEGVQKILYTNGNPKRIILYENALISIDSTFYIDGNIKSIKNFEDGELIHMEEYSEIGKKIKENNFLNTKLHGIQKQYFENSGNLKIQEEYRNGELLVYKEYYENGNLKLEANFLNNKKNGLQKKYDENGFLRFSQNYKDGILINEEIYNNNTLSKEIAYYKDGKVRQIIIYGEDGIIKRKKNFDKEGNLIELVDYDKGLKKEAKIIEPETQTIVWVKYDENENKIWEQAKKNNKIIREGKYKNNKKDGLWVYYALDGKSEIREQYSNGQIVDKEKLVYAYLIKNNLEDNSFIYKYKTAEINGKDKYYVVKYLCGNEEKKCNMSDDVVISLVNKLSQYFETAVQPVSNIQALLNKSLDGELLVKARYRFKPKTNKRKKVILQLEISFVFKDYVNDFELSKKYIFPKGIPVNYYSNNHSAIESTVETIDVNKFIHKQCFPRKGHLLKVVKESEKAVEKIMASFPQGYVQRKELFYIHKSSKQKAELKIISVINNYSVLSVISGGEWLKFYIRQNRHPVITERPFSIKSKH